MSRQLRAIVVAVGVGGALMIGALAVSAQTCDPYTQSCVTPSSNAQVSPTSAANNSAVPPAANVPTVQPAGAVAPAIQPAVKTAPAGQTLPLTGADILGLVVLAGILFGMGTLLVVLGRRREGAAAATTS